VVGFGQDGSIRRARRRNDQEASGRRTSRSLNSFLLRSWCGGAAERRGELELATGGYGEPCARGRGAWERPVCDGAPK
jgi:hypothetical protein